MKPQKTKSARGNVRLQHPAFGNISVSRVQGGARRLNGSDFAHNTTVEIEIAGACVDRELSRDWHHAEAAIVRIAMSEAQWATFVSSFNMGGGVPCTLLHQKDVGRVLPIEVDETPLETFSGEVDETLADAVAPLEEALSLINSKSASVAKLRPLVETALRELTKNLDFVGRQFGRHMEDTAEKAKVEIHAHMQQLLMRAGLEHLSGEARPFEIEHKGEGDK